jgi:hypothetical protein
MDAVSGARPVVAARVNMPDLSFVPKRIVLALGRRAGGVHLFFCWAWAMIRPFRRALF